LFNLIIDTSTDKSLVAFSKGEELLLSLFLPMDIQSSRQLMTTLASGFQQLQINPTHLGSITVSVGPGSYTGIRVGVAAAYGLALPRSLPLISFCSLEGFIPSSDGPFASLIDARIGGAYILLQEKLGTRVKSLSPPQFVSKENLSEYLKEYPTQTGPHLSYPDPDHLVRLAAQKLKDNETSNQLELIYLRTPDYRTSF